MNGCFVTGTDTGVGKTEISAAIISCLAATGLSVSGFKPVAAGTTLINGVQMNDDVLALQRAGSAQTTEAEVGPFQFEAACAPQIAAALEGRSIDRSEIAGKGRALLARCDFVVVEGAGGFRVPLGDGWDTSHIVSDLHLPVILVVGVRLGCINHALLTVEAVKARGLSLVGWVANTIDPDMPYLARTLESLQQELSAGEGLPCLGVVPWLREPSPSAITRYLDSHELRRVLATH
jgi:dethiobiotin synthetase